MAQKDKSYPISEVPRSQQVCYTAVLTAAQRYYFRDWCAAACSVTETPRHKDVTKTGNGERGTGNGERKSGNELSAETSTKIQNGGPKNEREKEEDKERNLCLG